MRRLHVLGIGTAASVIGLGVLIAFAQNKPAQGESERKVEEKDVPRAALDALKALAGKAAITEFAEEVEHGHTFYEGSWAGTSGNVDAVVTAAGDLVVIEEVIPADKVPGAAAVEARKAAGDAELRIEKKTMVLYEVHFKKDGKKHELVLTPDGRQFDEEGAENGGKDEDDEHNERD